MPSSNSDSVGVVLATYNGEQFLAAQLQSLFEQVHRPDRIVVVDDGSTDRSIEIARMMLESSGIDFEIVHSNRAGAAGAFALGFEKIKTDLIFPCDQDDVWKSAKIAILACELLSKEIGMAFCNADLVDVDLKPMNRTLFDRVEFGARTRERLQSGSVVELIKRNRAAGACMAFRSKFLEDILPIPPGWLHDHWIALLIALRAKLAVVDESLNLYRQHNRQVIGARDESIGGALQKRNSAGMHYERQVEMWTALRDRVVDRKYEQKSIELVEARLELARDRLKLHSKGIGRIPIIFKNLFRGNYHKYARGIQSAAADLIIR